LEIVGPDSIQFAESFTDQAEELGVRSLLRTTFDYHVTEFRLKSACMPPAVGRQP
jgi:hypothetical protein